MDLGHEVTYLHTYLPIYLSIYLPRRKMSSTQLPVGSSQGFRAAGMMYIQDMGLAQESRRLTRSSPPDRAGRPLKAIALQLPFGLALSGVGGRGAQGLGPRGWGPGAGAQGLGPRGPGGWGLWYGVGVPSGWGPFPKGVWGPGGWGQGAGALGLGPKGWGPGAGAQGPRGLGPRGWGPLAGAGAQGLGPRGPGACGFGYGVWEPSV